MNTVVSNWQIVSIFEKGEHVGDVLWAICVDDMTCRFHRGDYICTSQIIKVNVDTNIVETSSGSIYQVLGQGKRSSINFVDFELLRSGFSPQEIVNMQCVSNRLVH